MKVVKPKNEGIKSAKYIILTKIDVSAGDLTFGQRIGLGEIFESDISEVEKYERSFECLHDYKPKPKEYALLYSYFEEIVQGITYWIEKEQLMLKYEPTPEEISAGIKEFSANVGEYSTIKSLAKSYSKDPDDILKWKYGKVFGILYTDLQEHKFQKAYNKIIENKSKHGR